LQLFRGTGALTASFAGILQNWRVSVSGKPICVRKEVNMTRLQTISQTSLFWLCGATLTCGGGPVPYGSSTGAGGANAISTSSDGDAGAISKPGPAIGLHPIAVATSTATGVTVDKLAADGSNCGVSTSNTTKQPADLLLILDRSGSMTRAMDAASECAANSTTCKQRWVTLTTGLSTVLVGSAGNVNWGLKFYPSDSNCGVTAAMDVNISANAAATIQQRISSATKLNGTPTQAAVNAGLAYLKTLTTPSNKYILLATDGEPNCLNGTLGSTDIDGTVAAIAAAATAGFKTYVLGVGPETGNLTRLAEAGGTTDFYPALSPEEMTKALAAIVDSVVSCTFDLDKAPEVPNNVAVEFDNTKSLRAPQDTTHSNGWDYTSPTNTTIQLYGEWCDKVSNGTYKSFKVIMGCPDQEIP
jgi:hypothetical protein